MSADIRLTFNKPKVREKITGATGATIPVLAEQILKDSNYYARQDTGAMIASSLTHSDLKEGNIVWATVYAKKVYYTGTPSRNVNPNATLMWYETAKSAHLAEWNKLAQKIFGEHL